MKRRRERLVLRHVRADGSVTLRVRRDETAAWITVADSRLIGMDALNYTQTACGNPMVRNAYLYADPALFADIMQPKGE